MLASILVYLGLGIAAIGAISLLVPLAFLRIRRRTQALVIALAGIGIVTVAMVLPAREVRVATPQTRLDHYMPVYQFREFHSTRIQSPRDRVQHAIDSVTADEIPLFRTLTGIRRLGRPGPESILNAPEKLPILEVATRTSFLLLAKEPGREIVVGTLVMAPPGWRPRGRPSPEGFRALRDPGFALAAMNFVIESAGPDACTVTTETRVYATDAGTRGRFAGYWRVIYPGSALIRRMWLGAIKRRAEQRGY